MVPVVFTVSEKKLSTNLVDIINKNVDADGYSEFDDNEVMDMSMLIYLIYLLVHNVKKLVLLEFFMRKDLDLQLNAK